MAYSLNARFTPVLLGVLLLVAGCTGTAPSLETLKYPHDNRILLSARTLDVVYLPDVQTPTQDPQIINEHPLLSRTNALKNTFETWHSNRFNTTGDEPQKQAQLTVERLSVTGASEKLPQGFFEKTSSDLYRAQIAATLTILDDNGYPIASANAAVDQTVSVSKNATLVERDAAIANLETRVINAFDSALVHQIKSHLGSYLAEPI